MPSNEYYEGFVSLCKVCIWMEGIISQVCTFFYVLLYIDICIINKSTSSLAILNEPLRSMLGMSFDSQPKPKKIHI